MPPVSSRASSRARIQEIEAKLSTAEIIDPSTLPKNGKVVFGAVVDLEDQGQRGAPVLQIVGEDEADLKADGFR